MRVAPGCTARYTEGLVKMFAYHAEREDHGLFP